MLKAQVTHFGSFQWQVISPSTSSVSPHGLSKRYSVDILTHETDSANIMDHPAYHTRDTSSEPRFPIKSKSEELVPDLQKAPSFNFFLESDNMLGVKRKAGRADHTFLLPHDPGQFPMDTGQCLVAVFMQQEFCAFFYFKNFNQSLLMKHFLCWNLMPYSSA